MSEFQDRALREEANAWIARFAPLILDDGTLTSVAVRERLDTLEELNASVVDLKSRLASAQDLSELSDTVQRASSQLESLEVDLRKRLALLEPGDPEGIADLSAVNEKLAERMARQEIGAPTGHEVPEILEVETGPVNLVAAASLGVFGLGWNGFTLFHAILMIGGMWQAFGPLALLLLFFYAIFFGAGFFMLLGALNAASKESIRLEGRELTVNRKLGSWNRTKKYQLSPTAKAIIGQNEQGGFASKDSKNPMPAIVLTDIQDKPIYLATMSSKVMRDQLVDKLNAYLAVHGRD